MVMVIPSWNPRRLGVAFQPIPNRDELNYPWLMVINGHLMMINGDFSDSGDLYIVGFLWKMDENGDL